MASPGSHAYPSTKSINGLMDDDDGRTRNAKAQRRHREKRKAHLKTLEESVSLLTNQLEDARRQLSSGYRNGMGGGGGPPLSPGGAKDFMALQHDNEYLRQENESLRRQLFNYNNNIGGGRHYQPGDDVKGEAYGQYGPGGSGGGTQLASPRADSGREGQQAQSGENFTPRGSRSRVMSTSSNAAASPYVPPTSAFPTDPHAHALSQPGQRQMDRYPARYESQVYGSGNGGGSSSSNNHSPGLANAAAPHSAGIPRSGLGYDHLDMYSNRADEASWGPDAGPPPFAASAYPVPYGDEQSSDWRQGQDSAH